MKIIKVLCILVLGGFIIINNANSQDIDSKKDTNTVVKLKKNRDKGFPYIFSGGALWAGFGSYTFVDVNLLFGVQLNERVGVGLSGKYQYIKDKSPFGSFETSVYGGSVFSQIAVIKDFRNLFHVKGQSGIIAHIEYELLNTKYNYLYFDTTDEGRDRYWLNNVLIGGGYFQYIGKKSKTYIIILWNLNQVVDNPYEYPQVRIGFTIGI